MADLVVTIEDNEVTSVQVGTPGPTGPKGDTGEGVASGGSTGQALVKASGTDFDTAWAAPAPASHASSHQNGGADEISVAGLSGELADPQPVKTHASSHQNGGGDEISVAGLSGELADPQPVKTHDLAGSDHNSATLAQLNAKVSDATLDDSGDPRDPNAHAASHQNGGSDEVSVAGLSGLLADSQTPVAHDLAGALHNAATLSEINAKISGDDLVGVAATQTLTSKTIDGNNNTISNLEHGSEVDDPSSGVHGAAGSVVGTSDTQTLTNKTLASPTITDPSIGDGERSYTEANEPLSGMVKRFVSKSGITDNVATAFARITIDKSGAGTEGGGAYAIFFRGVAAVYTASSGKNFHNAARGFSAVFARSDLWNNLSGTHFTGAVSETDETVSSEASGNRNVAGVTMTAVEVDDDKVDLTIQIDVDGTSPDTAGISGEIEVHFFGAGSGPPSITEL